MNVLELQIGAGLLAAWLISLLVLWKTVDRAARPGVIRSQFTVDVMMLLSIMMLLVGVSLIIKGSGWFE